MISNSIFEYEDVVKHIFSYLPKRLIYFDTKMVSKNFYRWTFDFNKQLVEYHLSPISVFYHLTSAEKVVEFIVKHDFRKINLIGVYFDSYHLKLLAEQQKITVLQIDCRNILKWPKMESLQHIIPVNITEIDPLNLSTAFPNLTRIDLSREKIKGDSLGKLVNLTHINLENSSFRDDDLVAIASTCLKIQTINLSFTKVTDRGVIVLLKNCHNIQNLNISYIKVTGECFEEGVFENLSALNLSNNKITKKGYASIGIAFPNIKFLKLINTKTTNKDFSNILRACLQLEEIDLALTKVNDNKLTRIINIGRQLKVVNLFCTAVTRKKVRSLRKTFPNHIIIY